MILFDCNRIKSIGIKIFSLIILCNAVSCKKLVEVNAPYVTINNENVYASDEKATSVLTGLYSDMVFFPYFSGSSSIGVLAGLSADELHLFNNASDLKYLAYYQNNLSSAQGLSYGSELWSPLYNYIYRCNDAIQGISKSMTLNNSIRSQLLGEAKFLRAFFYFYLVNLFGDVPLALSTDYNVNRILPKSSKADVYKQIISDLKDTKEVLSNTFMDGTLTTPSNERVRPSKWAASALLARVYLYSEDWINAENEASLIINNTGLFSLSPLNDVFKKNSLEAIWQLQPVTIDRQTEDGFLYNLPLAGPNTTTNFLYLSDQLLNAFENGDQRRAIGNWIDSVNVSGLIYYYPYKYKEGSAASTITSLSEYNEYSMVLRLAEQYLIRAEARAQQNKISEAQNDLNAIRTRSGLPNTSANDKASLLTAILHERQVELFTEWGHRWLDLKRTNNLDAVMSIVTPIKSQGVINWRPYQKLYPILFDDVVKNPNLVQNTGY